MEVLPGYEVFKIVEHDGSRFAYSIKGSHTTFYLVRKRDNQQMLFVCPNRNCCGQICRHESCRGKICGHEWFTDMGEVLRPVR